MVERLEIAVFNARQLAGKRIDSFPEQTVPTR
jgi:hypothetical protein